jgi:hypothetical protein
VYIYATMKESSVCTMFHIFKKKRKREKLLDTQLMILGFVYVIKWAADREAKIWAQMQPI